MRYHDTKAGTDGRVPVAGQPGRQRATGGHEGHRSIRGRYAISLRAPYAKPGTGVRVALVLRHAYGGELSAFAPPTRGPVLTYCVCPVLTYCVCPVLTYLVVCSYAGSRISYAQGARGSTPARARCDTLPSTDLAYDAMLGRRGEGAFGFGCPHRNDRRQPQVFQTPAQRNHERDAA
eukprot:2760053-Rhodomonas_salina.5